MRKLLAAGFTLRQDATTEGTALFTPENELQARLALRLAGVRQSRRRNLNPAQRQAIAARVQNARRLRQPMYSGPSSR